MLMCRPLNAERLFWDKLMRQILSLKEARQVRWSVGYGVVLERSGPEMDTEHALLHWLCRMIGYPSCHHIIYCMMYTSWLALIPMTEPSDSGAGLTGRTTSVHYCWLPDTGQSLSGDCLISGCPPFNRSIQRPTGSSHAHFASDFGFEATASVGKRTWP